MIDKTETRSPSHQGGTARSRGGADRARLMPSFHDRSADEIDRIIEACVDGFQQAMQRQALNDDVPF